jgi:hypothetical protein
VARVAANPKTCRLLPGLRTGGRPANDQANPDCPCPRRRHGRVLAGGLEQPVRTGPGHRAACRQPVHAERKPDHGGERVAELQLIGHRTQRSDPWASQPGGRSMSPRTRCGVGGSESPRPTPHPIPAPTDPHRSRPVPRGPRPFQRDCVPDGGAEVSVSGRDHTGDAIGPSPVTRAYHANWGSLTRSARAGGVRSGSAGSVSGPRRRCVPGCMLPLEGRSR